MFMSYQYRIREFDVIHDFSHQHLASRFMPNLPSVNPFWHAPSLAQYPKAPYNIIALSQWAVREFQRVYHQNARYMQTIMIDGAVYKPQGTRGDRLLAIGRMSQEKGNLSAVVLCKDLGLPLDVCGGRGIGENKEAPLTDYETAIQSLCDGKQIIFHGEVSEEKKLELMQSCRALLYVSPPNYEEVTSHKVQECMLCGAPVIVAMGGANAEIVQHGVDGFLCHTEGEYKEALKNIDKLTPETTMESNRQKYSIEFVVGEYEKLYEQVKGGLRW